VDGEGSVDKYVKTEDVALTQAFPASFGVFMETLKGLHPPLIKLLHKITGNLHQPRDKMRDPQGQLLPKNNDRIQQLAIRHTSV